MDGCPAAWSARPTRGEKLERHSRRRTNKVCGVEAVPQGQRLRMVSVLVSVGRAEDLGYFPDLACPCAVVRGRSQAVRAWPG